MPLSPAAELLKQLIAFDSVSSHGTGAIGLYVADRLRDHVDELHVLECEGDTQLNVLARVGGHPAQGTRNGLLLSGHLDVVPAQEPGWTSPPFEPRLHGAGDAARVYGRGACDMKGSIACFIAVIEELDRASLQAPLWLLLSCNEEVGSLGVQHFASTHAAEFNLPGQCIVGEPTGLQVVRMHKGHLKLRITYHGKSSHTGTPQLGINAIEPIAQVIERIAVLQRAWSDKHPGSGACFAKDAYPIVNIVGVRGGSAWNVMPDTCEVDIGVRLLPGMESQPAIDAVRQACDVAFGGGWNMNVVNDNPPLLTPADATVHVACCDAVAQSESRGVPFASDGGVLRRDLGIDCVLFGPGSMAVAHQADEYVPLIELHKYQQLLQRVVAVLCVQMEG